MVSPPRLCRVKGVSVLRCNLPPALFAELPGSFTCHCGNTGVEQTLNRNQHTKLTLEKEILPPLLPGFKFTTFRSRVRRSKQQAMSYIYAHYPVSQVFYVLDMQSTPYLKFSPMLPLKKKFPEIFHQHQRFVRTSSEISHSQT